MGCYRRILVAIDGSADAAAALEHAVLLARDQNALLTLLAVAPPLSTPVAAGASSPPDLLDLSSRSLREATDSVPADIGIRTRLERGQPAETILRIAAAEEDDLIVMGSHGHGRVHRALLGSVSERVLETSPLPVLLIREGAGVERYSPPSRNATSSAF